MWIESLKVEGGILHGFDQRFSRKLNVLIGARGTGKSSVIELIRFCLGARSYTPGGEQHSTEHALGVLGDGKVTIVLSDGKQKFEVSRTAQDTEVEDSDQFEPPFVFSQAEIEGIGLQSQSRLRLIDGFLPARSPASGSAASSRIRSTTTEIRTLLAEIDGIDERTAELPKLQASLEALKSQAAAQTSVHKEIDVFRKSLTELTPTLAAARVRAESLGRTVDAFTEWLEEFDGVADRHPIFEPWPVQAGIADELADLRKRDRQAYGRIKTGIEELNAVAEELHKKQAVAQSQRTGLENRARDIRQKIEEKQKGASAIDKQIGDVTQRISVLTSLVELRKQRKARIATLTEQRGKLLAQDETSRQERTKAREKVAQQLNKNLGPAVRLTVLPYSQRLAYVSALNGALRGSGLRYAELAERISETYSPSEIANLAEGRDTEAIASALEITEERAGRLCDALRGDTGGALFTTIVEDDVQMELMDGTDYKAIDFLSMGQRCTVVLPIILRHLDRMIVLDQPEDHLDNSFVVDTLVKGIATRGTGAQTLVATHNPNIPVLGDADMVVHLESDGSRCFVRSSGSINKPSIVGAITTIMEGGREAFAKRADFYAKNLPNAAKS
ncbi:MAG: ATP-binding protein [Xanthobacteraceae bacterium]